MTHARNADAEKTPKDEQRTPPTLFKQLNDRFDFDCDAAATRENALCLLFMEDSLSVPDWCGYDTCLSDGINEDLPVNRFYCNPPYSRGLIDKFVKKSYEESLKGAIVVMLLPADISTRWWNYCMLASEWIRIKGRVRFNHSDGTQIKGSPKFGTMAVVFDKEMREEQCGLVVSEMEWR